MPFYRVREGCTYGAGGTLPAGSVVELEEAHYLVFKDKLIPITDDEAAVPEPPDPSEGSWLALVDDKTYDVLAGHYGDVHDIIAQGLEDAGEFRTIDGIGPARLAGIEEAIAEWRESQ